MALALSSNSYFPYFIIFLNKNQCFENFLYRCYTIQIICCTNSFRTVLLFCIKKRKKRKYYSASYQYARRTEGEDESKFGSESPIFGPRRSHQVLEGERWELLGGAVWWLSVFIRLFSNTHIFPP